MSLTGSTQDSYYCGACRDQYRGINDRGVTQTSPHEENNISQSPDSEEESHLSKAERRRSVTHRWNTQEYSFFFALQSNLFEQLCGCVCSD